MNASADWYFAKDSILSAAFFYKNIRDEIVNATTTTTQTVGGIPTTVTTTAPQNVSGSKIRGVEPSFVQTRFGFLPGPLSALGLSVNATLLATTPPSILMKDGTYRRLRNLIETANNAVNAQLLYSLGKFDAYLAYNHTGKLLLFVATDIASNDRTLAPSPAILIRLETNPVTCRKGRSNSVFSVRHSSIALSENRIGRPGRPHGFESQCISGSNHISSDPRRFSAAL